MINFNHISLKLGSRLLFSEADLVIHEGHKVGFIGPNGSGKSSLFSAILKKIELDQGEIGFPQKLRIASVSQETPALAQTALSYVLDGDKELRRLEAALLKAEASHDLMKLGDLYDKMIAIDAYSATARATRLLKGLGFSDPQMEQTVAEFSGGWRMRLNLAQALMAPSDLLLLDEPTNHLDFEGLLWLEKWLISYAGTLVLISHDREFLDRVVSHIVRIDQQQFSLYKGNYSAFEVQLAEQLAVQEKNHEKQQKQMAHIQKFIDRFRAKPSKARQAQSRIKMLDKMTLIGAVQVTSPFRFTFRPADRLPRPLLNLKKAQLGYDEKVVLKRVELSLLPDTRLGLMGPNGAGKSTLLKALAGELPLQSGEFLKADGIQLAYYAQHQSEQLDLSLSPLKYLTRLDPKLTESEARQFLGGFNFRGDRVFEPMQHFSGGEKARILLAGIVWQRPNVLLLDEPTNHLDLEMREALLLALQEYEGALVVISHDRHFIRSLCDELMVVNEHQASYLKGDLDDYIASLSS